MLDDGRFVDAEDGEVLFRLAQRGEAVRCVVCHRTKKPIGRDSRDNGLCDYECEGYLQAPFVGSLWPCEEQW